MNIIYLHGFNSDGNGGTASKLKSYYKEQIICPSYDYANADKAYKQLNSVIKEAMGHGDLVLCGTSLGGFFANLFSEKYNIKCILVNPSLTPDTSLLKFVGKNKNFSNGKIVDFTKEDAEKYAKYEVGESPNVYKTIFLGAKDTVIDPKNTQKYFKGRQVIIDQDEEHQVKDVTKIINLIDDMSNTFVIDRESDDDDVQDIVLKEHYVNAPPNDMQTKKKYADEVWDMLNKSYAKVGGLHGSGFSSKEDMIKNIPFWKMITRNGKLVAVILYKDKGGRKRVAMGTDGTIEGKQAMIDTNKEEIKMQRSYVEISGPSLSMFLRKIPGFESTCIPYRKVSGIIDDEIKRPPENDPEILKHPELKDYFYQRMIGGSWHTKLMTGKPGVEMN